MHRWSGVGRCGHLHVLPQRFDFTLKIGRQEILQQKRFRQSKNSSGIHTRCECHAQQGSKKTNSDKETGGNQKDGVRWGGGGGG